MIYAKLCTLYAQNAKNMPKMQKICKKYVKNMQFMSSPYFAYICKICTWDFAGVITVADGEPPTGRLLG